MYIVYSLFEPVVPPREWLDHGLGYNNQAGKERFIKLFPYCSQTSTSPPLCTGYARCAVFRMTSATFNGGTPSKFVMRVAVSPGLTLTIKRPGCSFAIPWVNPRTPNLVAQYVVSSS